MKSIENTNDIIFNDSILSEKQDTNLILSKQLIHFKEELLSFIGAKNEYLNDIQYDQSKEKNINELCRFNHVLTTLSIINENLSKAYTDEKIQLQILGVSIVDSNIKYEPFFNLKINDFHIEYNKGTFLNRYFLFDKHTDYLQIEPTYKVFKKLNNHQIEKIVDILNSFIAEFTQHPFISNQPNLNNNLNKTKNLKREQYLNLINEDNEESNEESNLKNIDKYHFDSKQLPLP